MNVALDAWAVLELLEGTEPAASRVSDVLEQQPVMSWINLGEVCYIVERDQGEEEADHPMSYADAFAAATAAAHSALSGQVVASSCATARRRHTAPPAVASSSQMAP